MGKKLYAKDKKLIHLLNTRIFTKEELLRLKEIVGKNKNSDGKEAILETINSKLKKHGRD